VRLIDMDAAIGNLNELGELSADGVLPRSVFRCIESLPVYTYNPLRPVGPPDPDPVAVEHNRDQRMADMTSEMATLRREFELLRLDIKPRLAEIAVHHDSVRRDLREHLLDDTRHRVKRAPKPAAKSKRRAKR